MSFTSSACVCVRVFRVRGSAIQWVRNSSFEPPLGNIINLVKRLLMFSSSACLSYSRFYLYFTATFVHICRANGREDG